MLNRKKFSYSGELCGIHPLTQREMLADRRYANRYFSVHTAEEIFDGKPVLRK